MKTVTLDALVPREDFEIISTVGSSQNTRNKTTLSIEDLKYDSFFCKQPLSADSRAAFPGQSGPY